VRQEVVVLRIGLHDDADVLASRAIEAETIDHARCVVDVY
jgi:hypothetical protein